MRATPAVRRALGLAFLALLGAACRSWVPSISVPGWKTEITEDDMRADMLELVSRFSSAVSTAADEIAAKSTSRTVRRRSLIWKVRIIPVAEEAALEPPREGYLELLVLCIAQRLYLTEGAGAQLFGDQQEIARDVALKIEAGARTYTSRLLPPDRAVQLIAEAEALARERPLQGEFVSEGLQRAFVEVAPGARFGWVFTLPMAPFHVFEGVESGAQAIHEFNATARQLGELAARLPQQTRWQLELFMYDLEDRETTTRGLAAFERLAASAETLPVETREQLGQLLAESSSAQQELRSTLEALRAASDSIGGTISSAQPLAESLERVAGRANEAGATWNELIARLRPAETGPPSGARPFDITEYERTATSVRDAAAELRGLLSEAHALETGLADALLWRGLALLAAFFALLLVTLALASRWFRTGAGRR